MIILGLHMGHDGSACVVKNGRLVTALSSERITRQKKSGGVPSEVIDIVLNDAGLTVGDIDAIALTDWYMPWSYNTIEVFATDSIPTNVRGGSHKAGDSIFDTWDRIWDDEVYRVDVCLRGRMIPGYNIGHQKAHCASAFYTSPFKSAWCVSMDSSGAKPKNNFMVARGDGRSLEWADTELCMVGVAYGHTCEQLGIGSQMYKAGSMMALAGYGTVLPHMRNRIGYHVGKSFCRQDGEYHTWFRGLWDEMADGKTFTQETSDSQAARDIASTMQHIFEECILEAVRRVPQDGNGNLCLSGGSFLNCNANRVVATKSRFKNVHLFPGCTDDGCAVGAALYTAHSIMDEKRARYKPKDICYLGPKYAESQEPEYQRIAGAIAAGQIVAWFQGRSEYGPRALGNRSILADPRNPDSRERINHQLKKREWYRPLSPSVLAEKSREWFDFNADSPFMLFTANCPRAAEIPAACHTDGTARMQTVKENDNPYYYRLIKAFDEITGVPMVLNTSLNVDGQPILEIEADAWDFWNKVPVDMLVLNGQIYTRNDATIQNQ